MAKADLEEYLKEYNEWEQKILAQGHTKEELKIFDEEKRKNLDPVEAEFLVFFRFSFLFLRFQEIFSLPSHKNHL